MYIPKELIPYNQWCCAGEDKIPRMPNGALAEVDNPKTWSTYEECRKSKLPYIGFVYTRDDPFTFVDLDDHPDNPATPNELALHRIIVKEHNTYTEKSLNGKGLHLIAVGELPRNIALEKTPKVAMYSEGKFGILTGRVLKGRRKIEERQDQLIELFEALAKQEHEADYTDGPEELDDIALIDRILESDQAAKFNKLANGNWQDDYPSQSEADSALMAILAFWTPNNEQAIRLFKFTALGQRSKAQGKRGAYYLPRTLARVRGLTPKIDMEALDAALNTQAERVAKTKAERPKTIKERKADARKERKISKFEHSSRDYFPPGDVGDIAEYIYRTAVRPVKEVAFGAAIAFYGALTGRAYNATGTGFNHYVVVLAKTGMGKEDGPRGIDRLWIAMEKVLPQIVVHRIGPSHFASGQAILKALSNKPSMLSVVGEFGQALDIMCDPRAPSPEKMKKKVMLDIYSKSGINSVLHPSAYSDTDKNTETVISPNLNILGDSTPSRFFSTLTQEQIDDGLASRFTVFNYNGKRPPYNKANAFKDPPKKLVYKLCDVLAHASDLEVQRKVMKVATSAGAEKVLDEYNQYCDEMINEAGGDSEIMLYNRAHLKAYKFAGMVATGVDYRRPIITREIAEYACKFVNSEIEGLLDNINDGTYSNDDNARINMVLRLVDEYTRWSKEQKMTYRPPKKTLTNKNIVPYGYLRQRLTRINIFKDDRRGATTALKDTLQECIKIERLIKIPEEQAMKNYRATMPLYVRRRP